MTSSPWPRSSPAAAAPDLSKLSEGLLGFVATGDPADRTRLTLGIIRDQLSAIAASRGGDDPNLYYLDGRELYGETDFVELGGFSPTGG